MDDYNTSMYETKFHSKELSTLSFLVTGGAGFIGSNLVEYLLKFGARKVRVLDNCSTGSMENLDAFRDNPAFEMIAGDIRNFNDCQLAVEGIDYVSHQAALGSVPRSITDPLTTNDVNITGFLNMLVASRDANVKRMVYAASSSTYGDHPALPKEEENIGNPLSPYAVTKYVNELYADVFSRTYNFNTIGLRYFNVFGPRQNPNGAYAAVIPLFLQAGISHQAPVINGDGSTSRDFTFVSNVVQANIKALFFDPLEKHTVVNIGCGEKSTLNELWQIIAKLTSNELQPAYRPSRPGDVKHSLASIEKAKNLFGYDPQVLLRDGLKIAVDWYSKTYKNTAL
jgi:UDP-N-acetylglucosamine/UDP-N-acetylgalactosamine 4-epimerase